MRKSIFVLIIGFLFFCPIGNSTNIFSQADVFNIRLEVKTRKHQEFLKRVGLNCPEIGECVCEATIEQTNQLRRAHFDFSMQRERKSTKKKITLPEPTSPDTTYRPIKLKPKKKGEPPDKEWIKK